MFGLEKEDLEQKIESNERKVLELEQQFAAIEAESAVFFETIDVTPEEVDNFVKNRDNFSDKEWEELKKQERQLQEILQREINNIRDPEKAKRHYKERDIRPGWLFVR